MVLGQLRVQEVRHNGLLGHTIVRADGSLHDLADAYLRTCTTVWLSPSHGPLLMDVIRTGLVTPVWCTSWRQDATTLIGPLLGLPPLPYVDLPRPQTTTSHPNGYLWKRDHVDVWLGDTPVAWVDDDFTALDHGWAAERTARGMATFLVQPDPHTGLLAEHLAEVMGWVGRLSAVRTSESAPAPGAEAA
ncbi:hypothetical protein ACWEKM_19695 [Streptomyces sp. NPDC004752]